MKKTLTIVVLFFSIFSSCNNDDVNKIENSCYANQNVQTISHNGETREYVVYVPSSYSGSSAVPLLFNFHGYGGSAGEFMNYADMRVLADSETFILIYPQGSCLNGASHWNPSLPGEDNKSNADDFGFVEAITNEISSQYDIDLERIYAAGYSNGGMMAYGLANYKSNLIAAVASVSGTMLDFNAPTSHPMPVIHLHGTADEVIPYNGSNEYYSAQSVLDYWVHFNSTITSPTVSSDSSSGIIIEHSLYDMGNQNVSVEHYKYIGGGHVWFSETYQGQNTSEIIWNFLSRYDINGLR